MRRMISCILVFMGTVSLAFAAENLVAGAPPAPKGFATCEEAREAMRSGEVERVETPSEIPDTIAFHDDVVYTAHDGVALSLDIFVPKEAGSPRPLLLFIHGGGWSKGKKKDCFFIFFHENIHDRHVQVIKEEYACARFV